MSRLSTCKQCSAKITKEEKIIISSKSYCKECAKRIELEKEEYKQLIETICLYYSIQCCTGLMFKQIKEYKEQFNYSYTGMAYTLWYIKEIEKKPFNEIKFGIAYVKYYYEKAKEYFEQQNKISKSVSIEKPVEKVRIINIKTNSKQQCKLGEKLLFDINSLF